MRAHAMAVAELQQLSLEHSRGKTPSRPTRWQHLGHVPSPSQPVITAKTIKLEVVDLAVVEGAFGASGPEDRWYCSVLILGL